jgi:hypothetical protein
MAATTIQVTQETRRLLAGFKTGGATYDDVIRGLMIAHPTQLAVAELTRRIREGKAHPIEDLILRSRRQPF